MGCFCGCLPLGTRCLFLSCPGALDLPFTDKSIQKYRLKRSTSTSGQSVVCRHTRAMLVPIVIVAVVDSIAVLARVVFVVVDFGIGTGCVDIFVHCANILTSFHLGTRIVGTPFNFSHKNCQSLSSLGALYIYRK